MDTYYAMVFETDLGKTLSVRVTKAVPDLPKDTAVAAMNKMLAANCFDPKYGSLTAAKSLKCVKTVTTPLDIGV